MNSLDETIELDKLLYESEEMRKGYFESTMSECNRPDRANDLSRQRKRKKLQVYFAPEVSVHHMKSHADGTQLWYRRDDYEHFMRDRRNTVLALTQSQTKYDESADSKNHCLRGLEQHLTKKTMLLRRLNALRHKRAVLAHQYHQRCTEGNWDPESLRTTSKLFSDEDAKRAKARASLLVDANIVS